jgi:CBS domain-containing protein
MLEKSASGKKEDEMPVFRADIMEDTGSSTTGRISGVSPISNVSISSSSVDAIEMWRYMSEVYKERRLRKEKETQKSFENVENKEEGFQKTYESDSINISSNKSNDKELMDIIMEKIWLANLDVNPNIVNPLDEEIKIPNDGTLRVGSVMSKNVISIIDSTTVEQIASLFNKNKITGVPVVHYLNKHVVGIVTMSDVIKHLLSKEIISSLYVDGTFFKQESLAILDKPAKDIMQKDVVTVLPDLPVKDVCKIMSEKKIHRVIVVNTSNKLLGILSSFDIVNLVAEGKI